MTENPRTGEPEHEQESFDHGQDAERLKEGATPGAVGALDGAAAAGSAGAVSDESDDETPIPESGPDPSVGPD
jgi:hypothetical protein